MKNRKIELLDSDVAPVLGFQHHTPIFFGAPHTLLASSYASHIHHPQVLKGGGWGGLDGWLLL